MKKSTLRFSAAFFASYLALQLGWQFRCVLWRQGCTTAWSMYSGRARTELSVLWRDGSESPVEQLEKEKRVSILGRKIDRERFWPPYLCTHLDDVSAVRIKRPHDGGEVIVACEQLQ